jgi:hypothetical protein
VKIEGRKGRATGEIDTDGTIYAYASSTGRTTREERAYTKKITMEVEQ